MKYSKLLFAGPLLCASMAGWAVTFHLKNTTDYSMELNCTLQNPGLYFLKKTVLAHSTTQELIELNPRELYNKEGTKGYCTVDYTEKTHLNSDLPINDPFQNYADKGFTSRIYPVDFSDGETYNHFGSKA